MWLFSPEESLEINQQADYVTKRITESFSTEINCILAKSVTCAFRYVKYISLYDFNFLVESYTNFHSLLKFLVLRAKTGRLSPGHYFIT